jgi:hypothetical protein
VRKVVLAGFCLTLAAELVAMFLPDRRYLLWIPAAAVGVALLGVRAFVAPETVPPPAESDLNDGGDALRRWLARTETLIHWSESTRSDWDRHLRPMLARQFEMATHQRQSKDTAAFQATGAMLFGAELWGWVDPENVERTGGRNPGPGRAALDEILQRLEQI